jgi:4'-phosphopantetheinyl transferase EntD
MLGFRWAAFKAQSPEVPRQLGFAGAELSREAISN